jgi:hypothetical protein
MPSPTSGAPISYTTSRDLTSGRHLAGDVEQCEEKRSATARTNGAPRLKRSFPVTATGTVVVARLGSR